MVSAHILLREPEERLKEISDEDLVARVRKLNGGEAAAELEWQLRHFREEMKHPELAEELKAKYLARIRLRKSYAATRPASQELCRDASVFAKATPRRVRLRKSYAATSGRREPAEAVS